MLLLFVYRPIIANFLTKKNFKWKQKRNELQSVTYKGSRVSDTLKYGYTELVWENIYWRFENLKAFEVFFGESAY